MNTRKNKVASIDTLHSWNPEMSDFLKDHQFQGIQILPGSFYLHWVYTVVRSVFRKNDFLVKDVAFRQIFLLLNNPAEQALHIELVQEKDNPLIFNCYSQPEEGKKIVHATGKVIVTEKAGTLPLIGRPEDRMQAFSEFDPSGKFYEGLAAKGNQYGPSFQAVNQIWHSQDAALAQIILPEHLLSKANAYTIHPAVVDACIQALSPLRNNNDQGRTYVLKGLEEMKVYRPLDPRCWSVVTLIENNTGNALKGDIQVVNDAGGVLMEIKGATFEFIDFERQETAQPEEAPNIVLSATFTADLLEQPLVFWSKQLDIPFSVSFAPYNQVFQQLLDPAGVLSTNRKGMNVLLVRFEDWVSELNELNLKISRERKIDLLQGKTTCRLPNGIEIAHLNQYETDYVFREIFLDQCYLKHGIEIKNGDCILDIGANIGLFSLFALQYGQDMELYAFEPSPPVFEILKTNASLYGTRIKVFNCGVSDTTKQAEFTFYDKSSVFSGFSADTAADKESIKEVIRNMLSENMVADLPKPEALIEEVMQGRLDSTVFTCSLKSVSDIINENGIRKIDLLKIDAEKSETAILKGIKAEHWPIIKQIVLEVHDKGGSAIRQVEAILRKKGFVVNIEEEKLLQRSGLFNVFATRPEEKSAGGETNIETRLQDNIRDMSMVLSGSAGRSAVPYLLCCCPPSPGGRVSKALHKKTETLLSDSMKSMRNVHLMTADEIDKNYPVLNFYDEESDKIGHIPYTGAYFTALGTAIARKYKALTQNRYKVIVLDCDQTLWEGVCGEDGPLGIQVGESHTCLQDFMIAQSEAGMLLCLCSKNNEEDTDDVFEKNTGMKLKPHHFVSRRINWNPKSENIRSLAEELQLGLESFIFIDDNPVEIAEVKAHCPEVLALLLPESNIPLFLNHIWDFDHFQVTGEDKKRTQLYHQNIRREKFRKATLTFKEFLASLYLDIRITIPEQDQLARISQLTYRTNQFNFTTKRRSVAEVQAFLESKGQQCRIVSVTDRFGDYGIVGAMLFSMDERKLFIESFMLSCRALGKGVEHRMMQYLGNMAHQNNIDWVVADFIPTAKNKPAFDFLESISSGNRQSKPGGDLFSFPVPSLVNLTFNPSELDASQTSAGTTADKEIKTVIDGNARSELAMHIAAHLNTTEKIQQSIEKISFTSRQVTQPATLPSSRWEVSIAEIWNKVLGTPHVGIHDNFFDAGGTSLKAVQLIALLKQRLNKDISMVNLFENPTIAALAGIFASEKEEASKNIKNALSRGAKRRAMTGNRKRPQS